MEAVVIPRTASPDPVSTWSRAWGVNGMAARLGGSTVAMETWMVEPSIKKQGIFVVRAPRRGAANAEPVEVGAQDELPLAAGGVTDGVGFIDVGVDLDVVAG